MYKDDHAFERFRLTGYTHPALDLIESVSRGRPQFNIDMDHARGATTARGRAFGRSGGSSHCLFHAIWKKKLTQEAKPLSIGKLTTQDIGMKFVLPANLISVCEPPSGRYRLVGRGIWSILLQERAEPGASMGIAPMS